MEHSLILFQDLLVSTTLSPDDTTNVFSYAVLRLISSTCFIFIYTSSWSYMRRAKFTSNIAAVSSIPTSESEESCSAPRDTSPGMRVSIEELDANEGQALVFLLHKLKAEGKPSVNTLVCVEEGQFWKWRWVPAVAARGFSLNPLLSHPLGSSLRISPLPPPPSLPHVRG